VTPACTLRELTLSDAQPLFDMMADPRVAELLPPAPPTVQGFEQFIVWTQQQRETGRSIVLGVVPPGKHDVVGFFQLHSVAPQFATAEWGFVLGSPYWGTGLFRAGGELMLSVIFDIIGVRRLEARAAVDNGRANGALRKMGATAECQLRRSFLVEDEDRDDTLWSLLDVEWRAQKAARAGSALEAIPSTRL
jgi:RimJ/RimL family protein N-acetyltransferase